MHVRTGGVGRKADAIWIVPLTVTEHDELHQYGQETFEKKYGVDLRALAAETAARWQREESGGDF